MIDIQFALNYLARCNTLTASWAAYVRDRLAEVERAVNRVEQFANLRPGGRVALDLCPIVADYRLQIEVVRQRFQGVT